VNQMPTDRGFVGQIEDDSTGLDYLGARYLDPTSGMFLTVDPLVATTGDPYLYTAGNPATLSDPNGLEPCRLAGQCSGEYADQRAILSTSEERHDTHESWWDWRKHNIGMGEEDGYDLPSWSMYNKTKATLSEIVGTLVLIGVVTAVAVGLGVGIGMVLESYAAASGAAAATSALEIGHEIVDSGAADEAQAITQAATEAASPWSLGPGPRGLAIEDALGGNLPAGFKTFDRFADGVATSIKSVDLSASSYQSAGALTSRLSGYVDSVAAFDNYSLSGFSLSSREISTRALEIAIQPGIGSSAQMAALNNVIAYGSSQGVVVRVVTVP